MSITLRRLSPETEGMPGWIAHGTAGGRRPGVILLHHAPGLSGDYKIWAARLAEAGLVAVVPDLYAMLGVPKELRMGHGAEIQSQHGDADFLAVFGSVWRAFMMRDDVDQARVGIIGHCMGGRLAIPFAADTPQVRALAIVYATIRDETVTDMRPRHSFDTARLVKCPTLVLYGGKDRLTSPDIQLKLWRSFVEGGATLEWHYWSEGRHGFANSDSDEFQPEFADAAWATAMRFFTRELAASDGAPASCGIA